MTTQNMCDAVASGRRRGRMLLGLSTLIGALSLSACEIGAKSGRGFRLPPGDVQAGKATFMRLGCTDCHDVADVALDRPERPSMDLVLGGSTTSIDTYGQLVTSIINPSHRISNRFPTEEAVRPDDGSSLMRNYNDVLRVTELSDLVSFLQSTYSVKPPEYPEYPDYAYR